MSSYRRVWTVDASLQQVWGGIFARLPSEPVEDYEGRLDLYKL
jgi:hypothetical protein